MKIQIDLNNLYCSNGQWKVHLSSLYDGMNKMEVIKKLSPPTSDKEEVFTCEYWEGANIKGKCTECGKKIKEV